MLLESAEKIFCENKSSWNFSIKANWGVGGKDDDEEDKEEEGQSVWDPGRESCWREVQA